MTQPFDKAELLKRLNDKGMTVAEDVIQIAVNEILDWTHESCTLHENPYVKAAGTLIPLMKPVINEALDHIDGKKGV